MSSPKAPSVLGGAMIAAGTMIGAGMLSLPVASAGMWFTWTAIVMVATVLFMYVTAEQILEVNLNYQPGASFDTLVKDNLGMFWRYINGFSVAFVLYILLYAYVVGFGSVISDTLVKIALSLDDPLLNETLTTFFSHPAIKPSSALAAALFFTAIVWWSTKAVDRLSTLLLVGMFITLLAALTGLLGKVEATKLFQPTGESQFAIYAFASLPFFLTSFCFHASVPSFVKYYGIEGKKIRKAIIIGMMITFAFYFFWMLAMMGNIDRAAFKNVGEDAVVWLLNSVNASQKADYALRFFSFFAVVTSFLGAGLGLFDYIADLFKINDHYKGRLLTAAITFIPPTILGMIFPNGFVLAIGYAGLFAAIWSVIIPGMMVIAFRKKQKALAKKSIFTAFGGAIMPIIIILYGLLAAISHILVEVFNISALNFLH